jgi:hypothetical protein
LIGCDGRHTNSGQEETTKRIRRSEGVDWLVKQVRVGTESDTPHTLRLKAKDFLRMAGETRDTQAYETLKKLADDYAARAFELENAPATDRV